MKFTNLLLPLASCLVFGSCMPQKQFVAATPPGALRSTTATREIMELANEIRKPLARARYMETRPLEIVSVPGWKGYPTRRYQYTKTDRDGTGREAEIVMLNPSAELLATWIVSTSYKLKGKYDPSFGKRLFKHVIGCSGGQFVVRGICLEDMDKDGIHKAYPFQDGVTVEINRITGFPQRPLTAAETKAALESTPSDVTRFYEQARLQSSKPDQWAAYTGTRRASGAAWLEIVRTEYQKAWTTGDNAMLTATAKALGF